VLQGRGGRRGCHVAGAAEDHPPVRQVGQRGEGVGAQQPERVAVQQPVPGDDGGEHHGEQGRQQPPGTPRPERAQPDPAGARVLGQQQ
jgi:hypothetical protein